MLSAGPRSPEPEESKHTGFQEWLKFGLLSGVSSATPSFPSQPEGKIGLPRANPRGRLLQSAGQAQPALQEPGPVVATGWRTQAEASVVEMRSAGAGMLFPEGGPERGEG